MTRKKKKFDLGKEVRKLARERVGKVQAQKVFTPKAERDPKHKKKVLDLTE